ncbi:MAG: rRNA maturation RNase YbeY [Bacilli bacterium]|jgi:probable rRNA maturation factor|nr:rRNA maturation RNase YbeY [Bacilli bacterium]MCH4211024.1 rRNA maturation RNase YbeY [Bacilli bacterium]MCH4228256.1 rRNA maturation RNase YbeY [Bacilli bacterium]MCH4277690.1 rRNA maturation RNase YbeY [Bacilli bacterium]MCI2054677.1 rRNA maturation RNase YbeY [Bacilli bacterium]
MEIDFISPFGKSYDYLESRYTYLAKVAFSLLDIKVDYEVDVSLVDDETIHEINRDYRHVDRVTDVISFAFNDDKDPKDAIVSKGVTKMLGEILICLPQAQRQAKEIGNSEERELSFLFVHGLLHLLGYDHMKKEDEEIMFPLQDKILEMAGKENGQN